MMMGKLALMFVVFLLAYLPSKPAGGSTALSSYEYDTDQSLKDEREKLVGSRPPGCVNKCLSCKPCMATLVIQPHHQLEPSTSRSTTSTTTSNHQEEEEEGSESYYLLSWKCKCGNKLFHP